MFTTTAHGSCRQSMPTDVKAMGITYSEYVKDKPNHEFCPFPPRLCRDDPEETEIGKEGNTSYCNLVVTKTMKEEVCDHARYWTRPTYKNEQLRIQFATTASPDILPKPGSEIIDWKAQKAVRKIGAALRGALEKEARALSAKFA
mmetsp:Transcript_163580/g.524497  ORF Transcript_163580/g.524497 Transcript_163580/m.524497 type:complete len:145 (+) Transcript_163580:737-1171(+)